MIDRIEFTKNIKYDNDSNNIIFNNFIEIITIFDLLSLYPNITNISTISSTFPIIFNIDVDNIEAANIITYTLHNKTISRYNTIFYIIVIQNTCNLSVQLNRVSSY